MKKCDKFLIYDVFGSPINFIILAKRDSKQNKFCPKILFVLFEYLRLY